MIAAHRVSRVSCAAVAILVLTCISPTTLLAADEPAAPQNFSGKVYLDTNRNGRWDEGERGLAGVRVTDGVQFVTTAADGSYRLTIAPDYMIPFTPARTVAVSWPRGKWTTGRWWMRLSEVRDSQHVDFGLREDVQKLPFAFVHISDDHGAGAMYSEHYGPEVRRMGDTVKFCFNTGDMGYATVDGAEAMFQSIARNAAKFPVPMFFTPGNHDFTGKSAKQDIQMDAHPLIGHGAMTRYCGPVRWSFDYAGVRFISLDYMEKTEKGYDDRVPRIAIEWADKDLSTVEPGSRIIVLVHCYNAPAEFFQLLRKHKASYVCCGHTHTPAFARLAGVPSHTNFGLGSVVVTDGAIDVAEGRPASFKDSRLFGYFRSVVVPAMEKRRQKQHNLAEESLENTPRRVEGDRAVESAELKLEIEPGNARRVVVRFGREKTVDLVFDGKSIDVAGVPFPVGLPPGQAALMWHILMDRDRLTLFANDVFRTTKAVAVDAPACVTVLAEGGPATLRKLDLWELRPVQNQNSRSLHHFAPPGWYWGRGQLRGALLEQTDPASQEMLRRYSADGIKDYGVE